MSDSERMSTLQAYRRAKNRLAVRKYRAEKAAGQAEQEDEMDCGMPLRKLEAVSSTPDGSHEARVSCGIRYNTKTELMHAIREVAEFLGTAVHFPLNNNFEVHTFPHPSENIISDSIDIQARYIRKEAAWVIRKGYISGSRGEEPGRGTRRSAYRMEDLARHVEFVVAKTPGASGAELIKHFKDHLRYPESFDGNQIARIRRQASVNVYGSPDDNCQFTV